MSRILMLWGGPAAGKTAIARAVTRACADRGLLVPHLASDTLRAAISDEAYPPGLREVVYDGLLAMADSALSRGLPVLLDANYLDASRRAEVRDLAARYGASLQSVLVRSGLEGRLERNRARAERDRVPDAYVREAHERADAARDEADRVIDTDLTPLADSASALAAFLLGEGSGGPREL